MQSRHNSKLSSLFSRQGIYSKQQIIYALWTKNPLKGAGTPEDKVSYNCSLDKKSVVKGKKLHIYI